MDGTTISHYRILEKLAVPAACFVVPRSHKDASIDDDDPDRYEPVLVARADIEVPRGVYGPERGWAEALSWHFRWEGNCNCSFASFACVVPSSPDFGLLTPANRAMIAAILVTAGAGFPAAGFFGLGCGLHMKG